MDRYDIASQTTVRRSLDRMMARHLYNDHNWSMAKVQKELSISRRDLRIYLGKDG